MVVDRDLGSNPTDHEDSQQLDTGRGSTVKLKRFEEILVKSKLGDYNFVVFIYAVLINGWFVYMFYTAVESTNC